MEHTPMTGLETFFHQHQKTPDECDVLAFKVNDRVMDLRGPVPEGAEPVWIKRSSPEGLEILRHDAAHVLAQALKEIEPDVQITIGPVIRDGFYYDILRAQPFSENDLPALEERMHAIVDRKDPIHREIWPRDKAIAYFQQQGEHFKVEIIHDLPLDEVITIYSQGSFIDLCRGPHMLHTGQLGHDFQLTKLAGAYWRGSSSNPMLQRIYGTAWPTRKELKADLERREEAQKRDHRKLGTSLDLFHIQDSAPGCVFWHPQGWTLYQTLETYMRKKLTKHDYHEVKTPLILDRTLWEKSGHWEKFGEHMFVTEAEKRTMALKPMNCPGHVEIFKKGTKSYRDLPLRLAEFGCCHRNEPSGALHGLMRVRNFVQDDAHIFCTEEQILEETRRFCNLVKEIYQDLGFDSCRICFSDRPDVRAGSDHVWDQAEKALKDAADQSGLEYTLNKGEGAFYGPKLEFILKDALEREWQCGTLQLDFVLPERLDAKYIGADGQTHRPVMLHRAILGSFERFIGVLIEHYGGKFPLWMSPTHAVVCSISDKTAAYAEHCKEQAHAQGLRVISDIRSEKIHLKIREHSLQKAPYIWVVGPQEELNQSVAIRTLGEQGQRVLTLTEAVSQMQQMAAIPA